MLPSCCLDVLPNQRERASTAFVGHCQRGMFTSRGRCRTSGVLEVAQRSIATDVQLAEGEKAAASVPLTE